MRARPHGGARMVTVAPIELASDPREMSSACFEKALDLLSRRPHFRRELERKLSTRGFPSDEVNEALERASELGYLDDLECARGLARVRVTRKNEGPARLYATLTRRGSDSETARRVADELYAEGEGEVIGRAAAKWLASHEWDFDRLARHLTNRGFSSGAVLEVLDDTRPRRAE